MSTDPSGTEDPDRGLDVDAAFADIVARFGPTSKPPAPDPQPESPEPPDSADAPPEAPDPASDPDALRALFEPRWSDPIASEATWDDEGHFVPPPPPPLPVVEPRRRAAWVALLASPLLAVLLVALDVRVAGWMAVALVVAFVGGFGYLVATMGSTPPDEWSGDDGAVI